MVILKVLNFMDASRCINKDFHAKEKKKCQHNGSKSILEEPHYENKITKNIRPTDI